MYKYSRYISFLTVNKLQILLFRIFLLPYRLRCVFYARRIKLIKVMKLGVALFSVGVGILACRFFIAQEKSRRDTEMLLRYLAFRDEYDEIASLLKVYDAKINNMPLKIVRLGKENDGGYVVPLAALEEADAVLGYGIADDISFERQFSQRYNKPSFGFDGGVPNIDTGHDKCYFYSECIGDDTHLYRKQVSSQKVSTYSEHLKRFDLENKKIFLKMDIEGAEFDVFDDILRHKDNITGIALECHMGDNPGEVRKLLSSLSRDFILTHVHGNNCCDSLDKMFFSKNSTRAIPRVLELTYINKNLVTSYKIAKNQKHPIALDQPNNVDVPDCKFEILVDKNEG